MRLDRDMEKESASGRKAPNKKRCMTVIGRTEIVTALVLSNRRIKAFCTAAVFGETSERKACKSGPSLGFRVTEATGKTISLMAWASW